MAQKLVDERIIETRRKVSARGFYMLLWGLLVILLYRQFYLGQEFSDYGDIFVVWLLASFYVTIAGTLSGLKLFGGRKINFLLVPVVIAFTILGVNIYSGNVNDLWNGLFCFGTALIASGLTYYAFILLYRAWEKKNLKE